MISINKIAKTLFITTLVAVLGLFLNCKNGRFESDYFTPKVLATHLNGQNYIGSQTCMECHADIYEKHLNAAHFNTSSEANAKTIKGSFDQGLNYFDINDSRVSLISEDQEFYQNIDFKYNKRDDISSKIDIVIGSGVKGQSYLTWEGDKLYQLQASYYTPTDSWVNSPGFPLTNFKRPISDACVRCHATAAQNHSPSGGTNTYDKNKMILGIDCERCHGPAEKHVLAHRKNPETDQVLNMTKISELSRQQRLDVCAQCHSGLRSRKRKDNVFSFLPGEILDEYATSYSTGKPQEKLDVHGNQYGLLTSSKCFINSESMDCITCHSPHEKERGDFTLFNQKCMECHETNTIECSKENETSKSAMTNDCVACHMPLSPSTTMQIQLDKDSLAVPIYIRTHLIDIYE